MMSFFAPAWIDTPRVRRVDVSTKTYINDSMSVHQEHTDCVYIEVDQSKQSVIQDVNVLMFKFVQDRSQENYPWTWTLPSSAICVNLSMYPTLSYTKDTHTSGCWFNLIFLLYKPTQILNSGC